MSSIVTPSIPDIVRAELMEYLRLSKLPLLSVSVTMLSCKFDSISGASTDAVIIGVAS